MVRIEEMRTMALALPEAIEQDHFGFPSFRVRKKIFATMRIPEKKAMVKLSPVDQSVFCTFDSSIIYPVPGGWGKGGATFIELDKIGKRMFKDALTTAYCTVAPPKLAALVRPINKKN